MKIIKISKQTAVFIYTILFFLTLGLAVLLYIQYEYFKQETQELVQLKDSYCEHMDMLKRSLNASIVSDSDEVEGGEDKKKNELEVPIEVSEIDFLVSVEKQEEEQEPQFALISQQEEHLLKLVKGGKLSQPKSTSSRSVRKRIKKISKPSVVPKRVNRYAPHRDFMFHWPIDLSKFWLSSLYGPRRLSKSKVSFHHGIDMASLKGTPVKAAASGKVILASHHIPGYGNCIMLEHNKRYRSRYAHLHKIFIREGMQVQEGDVIGTVGDTGFVRSSGRDASHLHFEIYQDGQRVNPLDFLFT